VLSEDDLVDILSEALARRKHPHDWRAGSDCCEDCAGRKENPAPKRTGKWGFHVRNPFNAPWTSLPIKRPFLSEYTVKQMVKRENSRELRIPASAILSPLAEEWLASHGIAVRRESA
jgi:hypothetical protein